MQLPFSRLLLGAIQYEPSRCTLFSFSGIGLNDFGWQVDILFVYFQHQPIFRKFISFTISTPISFLNKILALLSIVAASSKEKAFDIA